MASILVVEDESDVRDLLVLHLKREGYSVSAFDNAEEGLEAVAKENFDLAVLDWMLPQMTGLDLCKILRTKHSVRFPILLLTARADTMDKVLGLEIGADDYLTKPCSLAQIETVLSRLSQRRRADALSNAVKNSAAPEPDMEAPAVVARATSSTMTH